MTNKNLTKKLFFFPLVIIGLIGLAVTPILGATYPSKPIEVILTWPPGGAGDVSFRILAAEMTKHLGVPIVIKNIGGAGGVTGFTAMARSKPDGYTLGMNYLQSALSGQILNKAPYDVRKCRAIGNYVIAGMTLGVGKDTPYHSVNDFKLLKKPIRFCLTNYNSPSAIASIWMSEELGIPIQFISGYKGAAPAILGVIKGEGDAALYGAVMSAYFKSGDLRPLLAFNRERYEQLPDVPTVKEVGMSETYIDLALYHYVIFAPPNTPDDITNVIEQAMFKAIETKDISKKLKEMTLIVKPMTTKETENLVSSAYENYRAYAEKIREFKKTQQ